jgi:pyrimidine-specific ribonucleoside hydrolase
MKRKAIRIALIVVGVLILFIILIWPMAPLWMHLGLKPVCIQDNQGKIRIVACPETPATRTEITPYPLPTLSAEGQIPVIMDDDGSPDGVMALLYFLRHPDYDVRAVTISEGEAHPELFARHIARLLSAFGYNDIPVGYGRETPLQGENAFPEPWRQASDAFWDVDLPPVSDITSLQSAPELLVETLLASAQPVLVFVSGTHTNLAEALRLEPAIAEHIRAVYMMGGSVEVPGNIESDWPEIHNRVAEWNIWVDPLAASEVFASGLPLHLVSLDATNQVTWGAADARTWKAYDNPESNLAGDLVNTLLKSWSTENLYIWDLVAAVSSTDPRLCSEVQLALEVVTSPGDEQGRIVMGDGPANAWVCLDPDARQIKARVDAVFGR